MPTLLWFGFQMLVHHLRLQQHATNLVAKKHKASDPRDTPVQTQVISNCTEPEKSRATIKSVCTGVETPHYLNSFHPTRLPTNING